MLCRSLATLVAIVICCASFAADTPPQRDRIQPPKRDVNEELKLLDGTWKAVAIEVDGDPATPNESLVITGTEFYIKSGLRGIKAKLSIDPNHTPRRLEVTLPHDVRWTGIYELKDGKLRICFDNSGRERPTEFKTKEGTKLVLRTYERIQP